MNVKKWLIGWVAIVCTLMIIIISIVYNVDPFFHYHQPKINNYYYSLNNERSQNNGIEKNFDYDALITGTSMIENFMKSELDELFGVNSVKVPCSGGSYKEINNNVKTALENNANIKLVIRCLDTGYYYDDKDLMNFNESDYNYLYNANPLDDVKYIFNKDIIFSRAYSMITAKNDEGFKPGIDSFDTYANWQSAYNYGTTTVMSTEKWLAVPSGEPYLTEDEKKSIQENVVQNITSITDLYPDVEFYYFFSPYSAAYYMDLKSEGLLDKEFEAEKFIIEMLLEHKNIRLYSFNNRTDITCDLNNYKDKIHYGQWINSLMLRWMKDGKYLLTKNNYQEYLDEEKEFYASFDYSSLYNQVDYECDFYAAALLNKELSGADPINVLESKEFDIELSNAQIAKDQYNGENGIQCVEAKITIDNVGNHDYLVFYGKKVSDPGQPTVYVYDDQNEKIAEVLADYQDLDNEWHQYIIDLSNAEGGVTIVLNSDNTDKAENTESKYVFSGITLY